MRFVSRLLQNAERRRAPRQPQRLAPPDHEDLFLTLRQADQGQRTQSQRLERRMSGVELALAAVDDYEVGKRLTLVEPASKVSRNDLMHRCKVVDPLNVAHLEFAILGAIRPSVLEPDAGRDGVG